MNENRNIAVPIRIRSAMIGGALLYVVHTWSGNAWETTEDDPTASIHEAGIIVSDLLKIASEEMYHDRIIAPGLMTKDELKRAIARGDVIGRFVKARESMCRYLAMIIKIECHLTSATNEFFFHYRNTARLAKASSIAVHLNKRGIQS